MQSFFTRLITCFDSSDRTARQLRQGRWLVCLTTTPERLVSDFFCRVLDSILAQQKACQFTVLLFIPRYSIRTGEPYPDTSFLRERYSEASLKIHFCEDRGPATKFLGLLTYLEEGSDDVTHVYITDDDIILRSNLFCRMQKELKALWQREDRNRTILANDTALLAGMKTVAGYAGILFPVGFFQEVAKDNSLSQVWDELAAGKHPCFNVDDILLSMLIKRFGYSIASTRLNPFKDVMDRPQTDEHPEWFELCKHTARKEDTAECMDAVLP